MFAMLSTHLLQWHKASRRAGTKDQQKSVTSPANVGAIMARFGSIAMAIGARNE
jgi:hypothetical protein